MTMDAVVARDEGLEAVRRSHSVWFEMAISTLGKIEPGFEGVFEAFRVRMREEMDLPAPRSDKVWGAVARVAILRGILQPTGRYDKMQTVKSHARKSEILRRTWRPA